MDNLNFGIIGTGRIISKFCLAFKQASLQGGNVIAVASRDLERAREAARANGIPCAYGSYEELLENKDIDVVYVATTNEAHFRYCEMAIRSGKHVLCEKPITLCAKDARVLADLAKEEGIFLMEGLWTRFLPVIRKAQIWVEEGRIGVLRCVKACICARREAAEYPRLFDPAQGGGAALDLGIYGLHFADIFAGKRNLFECKSISIMGKSGVDITDYVLLEYDGGFAADICCSIDFSGVNEAYIYGENGFIHIAPWFNAAEEAELFTFDNSRQPLQVDKYYAPSGFEYEIANVIECIRRGDTQSNLLPLPETIKAIEKIDKIRVRVF